MRAGLEVLEQSLSMAPLALAAAKIIQMMAFGVPLSKGLALQQARYSQTSYSRRQ